MGEGARRGSQDVVCSWMCISYGGKVVEEKESGEAAVENASVAEVQVRVGIVTGRRAVAGCDDASVTCVTHAF